MISEMCRNTLRFLSPNAVKDDIIVQMSMLINVKCFDNY